MNKKDFSFLTFIIMIIFLEVGCSSSRKVQLVSLSHEDSLIANQKQWLKDYGFCMCLYYGKNKDTLIGQDISFSILREISDYPGNEYDKIDSLAKKFVLSIKPTQIADYENKKPVLIRCMEFHKSNALDSLISTLKH